jgi:hypothetical protein
LLRTLSSSRSAFPRRIPNRAFVARLATEAQPAHHSKEAGDISAVFPSLSGVVATPLPARFSSLKKEILPTTESRDLLVASWTDLLNELREGVSEIQARGSEIIPEVSFAELERGSKAWQDDVRKRGSIVVRDVIDDAEVLKWKMQVLEYVKENPHVKGIWG